MRLWFECPNCQISLSGAGVSAQLVESVTRTYVGTNAYMAPERVLGQSYSVKSDVRMLCGIIRTCNACQVWSLGLSVMELAVGRFPYPTEEMQMSVVFSCRT
jgi:serine/threonine protein kinase